MTLAYVESEDRMVDVEAMLREFDALPPISFEEGFRAAEAINRELIERGAPEMTMEEIDEEIAACREERRERAVCTAREKVTENSTIVLGDLASVAR